MKQSMQLLTSSAKTEWYTPQIYTDAAREVMGSIDLDPASCPLANEWIQANHIYTKEEDGLKYPWIGNVWLNPPFGHVGRQMVHHLCDQYDKGYVGQAVLLTKCVPGYKWWDTLFHERRFPVCFVKDRIAFLEIVDGKLVGDGVSKAGTNLWYLGRHKMRFGDVFSEFGRIV